MVGVAGALAPRERPVAEGLVLAAVEDQFVLAPRRQRAEDLAPAFARAAAGKRATLVDVVIDPSEYDAQILALRG